MFVVVILVYRFFASDVHSIAVYWSVPRIVVSACCGVMLVDLALVGTLFCCTVIGSQGSDRQRNGIDSVMVELAKAWCRLAISMRRSVMVSI